MEPSIGPGLPENCHYNFQLDQELDQNESCHYPERYIILNYAPDENMKILLQSQWAEYFTKHENIKSFYDLVFCIIWHIDLFLFSKGNTNCSTVRQWHLPIIPTYL